MCSFFISACSVKHDVSQNETSLKTQKLSRDITSLSNTINKKEAVTFSNDILTQSKLLAKEYDLVSPPLFHNFLVNINMRDKGLCYHFAKDLLNHLESKKYDSFELKRIVANRAEYFEHNAVLLTTKDSSFEESLVLDAWRNSGELFWSRVKDDSKYKWELK